MQMKKMGVKYRTKRLKAPGPELKDVGHNAADIDLIRVEAFIEGEDGARVPLPKLALKWALTEDIESKPDWPYREACTKNFRVVDKQEPYVFEVNVNELEEWEGDLARIMLWVELKDEKLIGETGCHIVTSRIEFVKLQP